jgi:hypothetical protein
MRIKLLVSIAALVLSSSAYSATIRATDLQTMCADIKKSQLGQPFDKEALAKCQGYLAGFFDTMIILEKMKQYQYFCIPSSVPKESNAQILEAWIADNSKIAKDTTASVALLAAYQKAFPCAGQNTQQKK